MDIIILLIITYFTGTIIEKRHFKSIIEREKMMMSQTFTNDTFIKPDEKVQHAKLVAGSCVVAADRFKVFLAGLRNIFGGSIGAYESLTERARREALLRMRSMAEDADMIVKMRLVMNQVGSGKVEVMAYGTAIYLDK